MNRRHSAETPLNKTDYNRARFLDDPITRDALCDNDPKPWHYDTGVKVSW